MRFGGADAAALMRVCRAALALSAVATATRMYEVRRYKERHARQKTLRACNTTDLEAGLPGESRAAPGERLSGCALMATRPPKPLVSVTTTARSERRVNRGARAASTRRCGQGARAPAGGFAERARAS